MSPCHSVQYFEGIDVTPLSKVRLCSVCANTCNASNSDRLSNGHPGARSTGDAAVEMVRRRGWTVLHEPPVRSPRRESRVRSENRFRIPSPAKSALDWGNTRDEPSNRAWSLRFYLDRLTPNRARHAKSAQTT